ncbi:uncharacterized protein LOC142986626 [Anticarsia gemmatalis]|uniref:uncharacterized protein LOC142986626 n=1 Tax=Anticarsia gemmatalis TaxID=129554 RepID=UPI003F76E933
MTTELKPEEMSAPGSDQPEATSGQSSAELAAITLTSKIPEFWIDTPRVWFYRVEAMLAPQKLADTAKFDIVVSKLSKEAIQQVTDLLMDPPAQNKFSALKTRLLAIYEESKNRQLQKLISEMDLGEQKPSQLLRHMRELAKDKIPDETLRMLWQGHLPSAVRAVLAMVDTKELDKLAAIADNVFETTTRAAHVSEVCQPQQPNTSKDTEMLLAEIAKLSLKIEELEKLGTRQSRWQSHNRSRSSSKNRSRGPSVGRRTPESPDWLCFYHNRCRARAKKCVDPCAWKKLQGN